MKYGPFPTWLQPSEFRRDICNGSSIIAWAFLPMICSRSSSSSCRLKATPADFTQTSLTSSIHSKKRRGIRRQHTLVHSMSDFYNPKSQQHRNIITSFDDQ